MLDELEEWRALMRSESGLAAVADLESSRACLPSRARRLRSLPTNHHSPLRSGPGFLKADSEQQVDYSSFTSSTTRTFIGKAGVRSGRLHCQLERDLAVRLRYLGGR